MINIYYTKVDYAFPNKLFDLYLNSLNVFFREKIIKYIKSKDRFTSLFGKLLLLYALKKHGYDKSDMSQLSYNSYGRPFLNKHIDFNISHSDSVIICAISAVCKLGVDIERIRDIKIEDFENIFTESEMNLLKKSPNCTEDFFRLWTIKESIIKADGAGLSIPLNTIDVNDNVVVLNSTKWFLHNIFIDNQYQAHLAINKSDIKIEKQYINPYSVNTLLP